MRTITLDDFRRLQRTYSNTELRRIRARSVPIERALRLMQRHALAFGISGTDLPAGGWTVFVAMITPHRLEEHLADFDRLARFWKQQWWANSGKRARIAKRVHEQVAQARSAIESWLTEVEPIIVEQHTFGMRGDRLLPKRERERFRRPQGAPTRPILDDERAELLRELRAAVRKDGGVVNPHVLTGLFDLAAFGDPAAIESLRRVRQILRTHRDGF